MIRMFSATALVAASLAAAPAVAGDLNAEAQAYRDPFYYTQNRDQGNYNENPAFTQGCPRGAIPESFPNSSGRRCALPGGGYSY